MVTPPVSHANVVTVPPLPLPDELPLPLPLDDAVPLLLPLDELVTPDGGSGLWLPSAPGGP